jgi:MtN3 and saliva related transmembrane protein
MKFEIFDPNVPLSMNILLVIANVLNLIYNIPQMVHTYRRKSTRDLSTWFLFLRILGNLIWVVYSVYIANLLMLINNVVTVAASVFVGYYKVREIIKDRKGRYINITIEPLEPVFSPDGGEDEDKWF